MKSILLLMGLAISSLSIAEEEKKPDYVKEALISSTSHDFSDTLIEGKMKAPTGFMISGRQNQSLDQLVKLRSNFRPKLKDSKFSARVK